MINDHHSHSEKIADVPAGRRDTSRGQLGRQFRGWVCGACEEHAGEAWTGHRRHVIPVLIISIYQHYPCRIMITSMVVIITIMVIIVIIVITVVIVMTVVIFIIVSCQGI